MFIEALIEHVVDKVRSGLSHRISTTAGRAISQVTNAGIDFEVATLAPMAGKTVVTLGKSALAKLRTRTSASVRERIVALEGRVSEGHYPSSTPIGGTGSKTMIVARGTNTPALIDGVRYSGHALDQMQGRGITPTVVKDVLGKIEPIVGKRPDTLVFYDSINNVTIIKSSSLNQIITVSHGKIRQ